MPRWNSSELLLEHPLPASASFNGLHGPCKYLFAPASLINSLSRGSTAAVPWPVSLQRRPWLPRAPPSVQVPSMSWALGATTSKTGTAQSKEATAWVDGGVNESQGVVLFKEATSRVLYGDAMPKALTSVESGKVSAEK